jgi:nicotinamide-nucleotide amidase
VSYTAEIISVGTELLLGYIANTDAQAVSRELSALGINVYYHTVAGDNPARLKAAVEIVKSRADIIITTGGLGPTYDDLTKQTLAEAFGKRLQFHAPTAERIRTYFREMLHIENVTENNLQQAMLPEGCTLFQNDWGTAPGCAFEAEGWHVLMLPGPPRECRAMLTACAIPYLRRFSNGVILSRNIRIFGMGEAQVEDKLRARMLAMENPTLAPYAMEGEVLLRVTARAETEERAAAILEPEVNRLKSMFGPMIYGVDVDSMEAVVLSLLKQKKMTLAVAESCTGGFLAKRITDVPGSSEVFIGGVVSYSNESKNRLLGVPPQRLDSCGAVSREVSKSMAAGVLQTLGANLALAITGVAGPEEDERHNPVGLVHVALASNENVWSCAFHLGSDRSRIRTRAVSHALDMLRRYLAGMEIEEFTCATKP